MKTLCELKRKDIAKQFEVTLENLTEAELAAGFLCRDCLRFSCDKKRLCEPLSLKKFKRELDAPHTREEST